ncbi:MAG: protein phosphatase 2C domain-containing protein [Candidatus Symbiothrix sp.]|jgi:serine/threonine protein phosphatase PrpC|nr:protein phosphatase 2C domain-containing protein [Candidatus Symbiothrix sp.]
MKQAISFGGKTDQGEIRTNNEDAFVVQKIWDNNHILAVVIDGVGGYEGGEVAADIAQKAIVNYLKAYPNGERIELLKQAVIEANNKIFAERAIQTQFSTMSCVLTACLVEVARKQINMVHVGDTRLYQYWHNKLTKLSHDHSLVGYREEVGDLSEDEAMNHPQRNVINRDLGSNFHEVHDEDFLEAAIFPLQPNSILVLCSDGLSDMLKSLEIVSVLKQKITLKEKVQELIDCANRKGGQDNITVVLVEYQSNEPSPVTTKIETEQSNIRIEPIELEEKSQKGRIKKGFIALIALAALAIGFAGGWFGKMYLMNTNNEIREVLPADSCSTTVSEDTVTINTDSVVLNAIDDTISN